MIISPRRIPLYDPRPISPNGHYEDVQDGRVLRKPLNFERVRLNPLHPLNRGLLAWWMLNEGIGLTVYSVGKIRMLGARYDGTGHYWSSSTYGNYVHWPNDGGSGAWGVQFGPSNLVLPLSNCSIVIGYKKLDATNRECGAFGILPTPATAARCGAHIPWSDGTVYWDFGGYTAGTTRVSAAGLTFGDDLWIFSVGAAGMQIWQNGFLRASNSSNPSRTASTNILAIGNYSDAGTDLAACRCFAVYDRQLTAAECISMGRNLLYGTASNPRLLRVM